MQKKDAAFMKAAIEITKRGIGKGQSPFGACIAKNSRIVSCVHNSVWKSCDSTAHAEVNAIRAACKKLKSINLEGCTIYSTTEPCPMCFSAIHWAKISRIVYGASIKDAKKAGFHEIEISDRSIKRIGKSRIKVEGGFMAKECRELFHLWEKAKKGKPY